LRDGSVPGAPEKWKGTAPLAGNLEVELLPAEKMQRHIDNGKIPTRITGYRKKDYPENENDTWNVPHRLQKHQYGDFPEFYRGEEVSVNDSSPENT